VFKNGLLRETLGPKRDKVTGRWRRLGASSVVLVTKIKVVEMSGACGTHGREMNTRFEERGHLVDMSVDGRIILK
jgi:high-affinity nickel permease